MAKIRGLSEALRNIQRMAKTAIERRRTQQEIGEFVVERIRAFSRSGRSISGKSPRRFKGLSKSYIAMRRGLVTFRTIGNSLRVLDSKDPRLDFIDNEFFGPSTSNITFSGQLLRSLEPVWLRTRRGVALAVEAKGRRKRLPGEKRALKNEDVARFVAEQGRPFIGLDTRGRARVKKIVTDQIRREKRRLRR